MDVDLRRFSPPAPIATVMLRDSKTCWLRISSASAPFFRARLVSYEQ